MKRFAISVLLAACTGSPTNATCPTENAPTYASFGQSFFTSYCTGCHSANAADRHGAPADQNYDSEADIQAHALDIDQVAAKGPAATNVAMPDLSGPVAHVPSEEERAKLGEYLACMAAQ